MVLHFTFKTVLSFHALFHGTMADALVTKSYSHQDNESISLLWTVGQISCNVQSLLAPSHPTDWVFKLSQFKFSLFVPIYIFFFFFTIWVLSFVTIWIFDFGHNLSFGVWQQLEFLSCQNFGFWVLSQFEF